MRLLLTAFFLESGVVLLLAPWSSFWDRNYFVENLPAIRELLVNNFVRGAVSGLGLVNIAAAAVEVQSFFAGRQVDSAPITLKQTAAEE